MSLAVMQLRVEATLWWDAMGYIPWHISWVEFTTMFLPCFAPLDLAFPSTNQITSRYEQFDIMIHTWGANKEESMTDYVRQFEQNVVQ